ncbi:MAG: hypothetical protein QOC60_1900 [Frankiaceae bacterium]|nr:hypothetical protein [Frankiaceae bacterium]
MPTVASRICIVGTSGSGKSHLARRLAARTGLPLIELDALHHRPGWVPAPPIEFRAEVAVALARAEASHGGWIVDGDYGSKLGDTLDGADVWVWLDLPRWLVLSRIVRRTLARALTRRELWNGNREDWRAFLSRSPQTNIILWSWTRHSLSREQFEPMVAAAPDHWLRLRTPGQTRAWLAQLDVGSEAPGFE